jgi:hypothetical protein
MRIAVMTLMMLALTAGRLYGSDTDQPPPPPDQEQPEVLTSGPVHEAFAEPVNLEAQAGLVAPEEPPAKIQEIPPADKPQGNQFVWVPGYWAWDADRHGYIWISACWRAAPPQMCWVPGYWARVPEGWEWVPGFWTPAGTQKVEYLPVPPVIENVEPLGPPPSPDDIWAPPCRYWYEGHYVLRPGYWVHGQPGWIWVPSHYVCTPRGYVFAGGHWDYALDRRGVLFAPVYLPRHVRERPHFSYSLSIVIDMGMLRVSLFTCPRYSHYYFGDYYDDAYLRVGIYPRFESERRHTWYDPLYEHDRWRNRKADPHWEENERHQYDLRRADKDLRPPRTYHEMQVREAKLPEPQRRSFEMARPMSEAVTRKGTPMKFEPVSSSERRKISRQATDVDKFRDQRNRWESPAASRKTVAPLPESKGTPAPSPQRKGPASASGERKGPATGPTTPTPAERKDSATRPTASTPTERKDSAAAPTERPSRSVSPRDVKVTKPETVKIPKSPIVGKAATENKREVAPPSKPTEERQNTRDTKGKDAEKKKSKDDDKSR